MGRPGARRHVERRGRPVEHEEHRLRDRGLPGAAAVDDRVLRAERVVWIGELRRVPDHVVRARGVQRLVEGDGPCLRREREVEVGVRLLEQVDGSSAVAHLHRVHEGERQGQARREHEAPRGHRGGKGLALLDQLDRGSRETLARSEEHTSELQSRSDLVCRLLLEKKKKKKYLLFFLKKKKKNTIK